MTELSLQAQAVYDAYRKAAARPYYYERNGLVAALQAAADQVVPERIEPPCGEHEPWPQSYQLMSDSKWEQRQQTRAQLLAIAAELEGGND